MMQEASVSEVDSVDDRTIAVRGFPTDCEVSNVVVASALHRTYKVRTSPSMIVFHDGGEWCSVKLASSSDRRRILTLANQGTYPIFHNRDPQQPSTTLEILAELPHHINRTKHPMLSSNEERYLSHRKPTDSSTQSIIQLMGLPGTENELWDGVRMTPAVIASMIHR